MTDPNVKWAAGRYYRSRFDDTAPTFRVTAVDKHGDALCRELTDAPVPFALASERRYAFRQVTVLPKPVGARGQERADQ